MTVEVRLSIPSIQVVTDYSNFTLSYESLDIAVSGLTLSSSSSSVHPSSGRYPGFLIE